MPKALLRRVNDAHGDFLYEWVMTWCPGCEQAHPFRVKGRTVTWEWDGNLEAPTFSPSYLTWSGDRDNPTSRCHSFLRAGVWEFLQDSTHSLAGQSVPMVDLPDWLVRDAEA